MKVIKRNGKEEEFCLDKIVKVISLANRGVPQDQQMNEEQKQKVLNTICKKLDGYTSISVEDINDFVEQSLVKHNKAVVLHKFIVERENKKNNKKYTSDEEKILALIDGDSDLRGDNANKHIDDNGSVRDYIAGIKCKTIAEKQLPRSIISAHKSGLIHWHDMDYSPTMKLHNCDLLEGEDMFKNSFMMGDTKIEPDNETPFRTACNLLAQINLIVSGRQYGGQTVSWAHLLPFIDYSRQVIKKEIIEDFAEEGIVLTEEQLSKKVEKKLRKEIKEGVKTYQYQILCHQSSNGQTPFVSNNLCLREAETEQELKDFAILIEEIFKRRIKGVKDKNGHYTTPLFPKLLYWMCDGLNVKKGDPYFYLTELAAECIAKRMQPDIVSEKETRRVKEGQIIPSMGCVDKDEIVTYRIGKTVYTESIKRMWDKMSTMFEIKLQEATDCYYIDLSDVEIYDSTSNGFVECKRMNKNSDEHDWKIVKLSNGRVLTCTSNHPLAVKGVGRTFVSDLHIGDEIECTTATYQDNNGIAYQSDYAWLLGIILCNGFYDMMQLSSTFASENENDIIDRYKTSVEKYFGLETFMKELDRGNNGNYKEVRAYGDIKSVVLELINIFGGTIKNDRRIPVNIFNANRETRLNFLGGMIDANGYIHNDPTNHFNVVDFCFSNKELALGTLHLINSLGYDGKIIINNSSSDLTNISYKVYFNTNEEILNYITSQNKKNNYKSINHINKDNIFTVNEIIDLGFRDEYSYDVTTSSDRFDVSGIKSHNCRSLLSPIWEINTYPIESKFYWTKGNGHYPYGLFVEKRSFENIENGKYDTEYPINFRGNTGWLIEKTDTEVIIKQPKVYGRWNNGVVTINLPHVALESVTSGIDFYKILDERLELCHKALQIRYKRSQEIVAKNSSILWQHGALARLKENQTVGELMEKYPQRASISLGFVGLYETCRALIGQSNTTDEGRKISKEILEYMNQKCNEWKNKDHINYSIYGTPEESLTLKFAMANRKDFGVIPYITDKDYVVNSYHVDPRENIDAFTKLKIEGEYLALSAGGAVSYVEIGDLTKNTKAIINIIQWMYENIVYAEINRVIGICYECGYDGKMDLIKTEDGKFKFVCPHCGNSDDNKMNVKGRLCGYLGEINAGNTNIGRLDDIYNRVLHLDSCDDNAVQELMEMAYNLKNDNK